MVPSLIFAVSSRPLRSARDRGLVGVGGFVRVVGAAHQGAGLDVHESEVERDRFQFPEFIRVVLPRHGRVRVGRPQVLTDREDPAADLPQVAERGHQLVVLFAQTDHQPGLGRDLRCVGP